MKRVITDEHRKKLSLAKLGNKNGFKKGGVSLFSGKSHSTEIRKKISETVKKKPTRHWLGKKRPDISREKNYRWTGVANLHKSIRGTFEYRQWRIDVFTRDNWTCQGCGVRGCVLESHHIKSFAMIMRESNIKNIDDAMSCVALWDRDNGVSLCKECHALTDNYKGKQV